MWGNFRFYLRVDVCQTVSSELIKQASVLQMLHYERDELRVSGRKTAHITASFSHHLTTNHLLQHLNHVHLLKPLTSNGPVCLKVKFLRDYYIRCTSLPIINKRFLTWKPQYENKSSCWSSSVFLCLDAHKRIYRHLPDTTRTATIVL